MGAGPAGGGWAADYGNSGADAERWGCSEEDFRGLQRYRTISPSVLSVTLGLGFYMCYDLGFFNKKNLNLDYETSETGRDSRVWDLTFLTIFLLFEDGFAQLSL